MITFFLDKSLQQEAQRLQKLSFISPNSREKAYWAYYSLSFTLTVSEIGECRPEKSKLAE